MVKWKVRTHTNRMDSIREVITEAREVEEVWTMDSKDRVSIPSAARVLEVEEETARCRTSEEGEEEEELHRISEVALT